LGVQLARHCRRAPWFAAFALALVACGKRRGVETTDASFAGASDAASATAAPAASRAAPRDVPAARAVAASADPPRDGGSPACKIAGGPTQQSFTGPALLRIAPRDEGDTVELVYNEAGTPRVYDARLGDAGARGSSSAKSVIPPCSSVGNVFYCPDATGAVHASKAGAEGDAIVARSRAGTRVAAGLLAGRPVVAYLADRITSEGLVREAWVAIEGAPPTRVSEDGSGATFVDLAPRGDALVVLTIDARVAMTPAHARILTLDGANKLAVGKDAVIFVGGSAERQNAGTLATSSDGTTFALVAVAEVEPRFGMAAIKVDDPPVDDANVIWSFYPNGIDPAPIAATRGEAAMHVARVRPKTAEPAASHVLEIGELEASGAFRAACVVAESEFIKDVEIARDRQKSLWVFYRTAGGSYLVRVATS
jgi:hypothetical protein